MYIKAGNQLFSRSYTGTLSHAKIDEEEELYEELLDKYIKKICITKEDESEYKNEFQIYLNNAIDCFEEYKKKKETPVCKVGPYIDNKDLNKQVLINYVDQYLRLKKTVELMERYEKDNNIRYDYIIRIRFDILNLFTIDINKLNKNITLFAKLINNKGEPYFTKDCFFLGKRYDMVKICKDFVSKICSYHKDNDYSYDYKNFKIDMNMCIEAQFLKYIVHNFKEEDYGFVDYFVISRMITFPKNHPIYNYNLKIIKYIDEDKKLYNSRLSLYVACLHKCDYSVFSKTKQISITKEEIQNLIDNHDVTNMIYYLQID